MSVLSAKTRLYAGLLLTLSLLLASCSGKDEGTLSRAPEAPHRPAGRFAGKSIYEVIQHKYHSLNLVCSLWVQDSPEVDLSRRPSDRFRWNLKRDFSTLPRLFNIHSRAQRGEFQAQIRVEKTDLMNGTVGPAPSLEEPSPKQIVLKESVYLEITGVYRMNMGSGSQELVRAGEFPQMPLYEKIAVDLVSGTERSHNARGIVLPLSVAMSCELESDIKPPYRDDYYELTD